MATFAPTSGQIRASDLRTAFGGSGTFSFSSLRGRTYYKANAYKGTIPSSGTFAISSLYGAGGTSPVTAGSQYWGRVPGSYTFVVPMYSQLQIDLRAAGGGGAGGDSNYDTASAGADGGYTYILNTLWGAEGGKGGAKHGNGAQAPSGAGSDHIALGGAGGGAGIAGYSNGGVGGDGGFARFNVTNPVMGGTGPAVGSTITMIIGGGGAGGAGSAGLLAGKYPAPGGNGAAGMNGEAAIYWT